MDEHRCPGGRDTSRCRHLATKEELRPWLDDVQQHSPSSVWAEKLLAFQADTLSSATTSLFSTLGDAGTITPEQKSDTLRSLEQQIEEALDDARTDKSSGNSTSSKDDYSSGSSTPTLSPSLINPSRSDSIFNVSSTSASTEEEVSTLQPAVGGSTTGPLRLNIRNGRSDNERIDGRRRRPTMDGALAPTHRTYRGTSPLPHLASFHSPHQSDDRYCSKNIDSNTAGCTTPASSSTLYRIPMHVYQDKPLPDSPTSTYSMDSSESEQELKSYWSDDSESLDDEVEETLIDGSGSKSMTHSGGDNLQRLLTSWKGLRMRKASIPNLRSRSGSTTQATESVSPKTKTIALLSSTKQSEPSPSSATTTSSSSSLASYSPFTTKHTSLPKSTLRRLSSFKQRRPSWHETQMSKEWSDLRNV